MKGSYILLMKLSENSKVRVGKLGIIPFGRGYYCYVGSAMNSLEGRIERHLKADKRRFWHIDYFLQKAKISKIFYFENERIECDIASNLENKFDSLKGFGCSDCKCKSHLFFSRSFESLESEIRKISNSLKTKPSVWD
jgi:Uri superfamily endonuclease